MQSVPGMRRKALVATTMAIAFLLIAAAGAQRPCRYR
jgi:hypothetical protein